MHSIPGISGVHSQHIINLFNNLPQDTDVILFGSRAKGNFREGSDIDVALKGGNVTPEDRDGLLSAYEDLFFPWKLDLVIYSLIQEDSLREHIDRVGISLTAGTVP